MRSRAFVVLLLVVGVLASGCAKRTYDSEEVIDFIDATQPHSYRLDYTVTEGDTVVNVRGIVEDDFRYKLQLALDEEPAAEQIVVDDGVALRFLDTDLVEAFTDPAVEGEVDLETDVDGATVFDALGAGRWVLDPSGAPNAVLTTLDAGNDPDAPRDPMFDARTALEYVRRVAESNTSPFKLYDPESLEPTYRSDEDPFPIPTASSGITRYDSVIADLPPPSAATSGDRTLPSARNFRKMAVYVKDDVIIEVREFIGVTPRQRDDFIEYVERVVESTAGDEVLAAFRAEVERLSDDDDALTEFVLGGINTFITSTGAQPIRFREMSITISDLDEVTTRVRLPGDVITGDLAVIRNLGRKPLFDDTARAQGA